MLKIMASKKRSKFKVKTLAIYDFTDCEGCEIQFLNLRNRLAEFDQMFEIIDWRLLQNKKMSDPTSPAKGGVGGVGAIFIEGIPATKNEIETLKLLRDRTDNLIALGACAQTGGVPGIIDAEKKQKMIEKIYGPGYKAKSVNSKPLSAFVKIDYWLSGCPVNPKEIKEVLTNIYQSKKLTPKTYPVCLDCKISENHCLLKFENQPCMGPITKAGCGAICPKNKFPCFGCWGPLSDANIEAYRKILQKKGYNDKEISDWLKIIWNQNE
jgi:coenzyme F420-reducing hydrogenase gamma subunit